MSKIKELELELRKLKAQEKEDQRVIWKDQVLERLNSMVGRCYMKPISRSTKKLYRILGVKHTVVNTNGRLNSVVLKLDKIVNITVGEEKFGRKSAVYNYFQDNPYGYLEEAKFTCSYKDDKEEFDFSRSINNFTMFIKEIPTEQYEMFLDLAEENTCKTEVLLKQFNIK